MNKTEIVDLVSRKLAPFMFVYGLYLLLFGHMTPGGGFQGGVVISSGVILLAMNQGPDRKGLSGRTGVFTLVESAAFVLLLFSGLAGIAAGAGFLGNPMGTSGNPLLPRASFILLLNLMIGLKVAAGISLICLTLFRES